MAAVTIVSVGPERIDDLTDFWLQLHRHQGALSRPIEGVPLRADGETGPIVRGLYLEWLSQPDSFAFIAELDNHPVGYLLGYLQEPSEVWDTGRIGYIDSFLVVPDVRGQGVGRRLLDAAFAHLRAVGVRTVGLDVVSTNTAARQFYEKEGFVPTLLHMYRALPVD